MSPVSSSRGWGARSTTGGPRGAVADGPCAATGSSPSRDRPESDAQRVMAGVLDTSPGSALHGPSTLAWLGLSGFDLRTIHVGRPNGLTGSPSSLAVIHRLRALRAHDIIVVRGVVTETALRAIWCEAARYSSPDRLDYGAEKIGRLLDNAHKLDLVTWGGLAEMVDDIRQRGRAGTTIMRALAEARPPGSSPTESRQEDRFEKSWPMPAPNSSCVNECSADTSPSVAAITGIPASRWPSRSTASSTTRRRPTGLPMSAATRPSTSPISPSELSGRATSGANPMRSCGPWPPLGESPEPANASWSIRPAAPGRTCSPPTVAPDPRHGSVYCGSWLHTNTSTQNELLIIP